MLLVHKTGDLFSDPQDFPTTDTLPSEFTIAAFDMDGGGDSGFEDQAYNGAGLSAGMHYFFSSEHSWSYGSKVRS